MQRGEIKEFLKDATWQFPRASRVQCRGLHRIFDPKRAAAGETDKLKGNCSEFLGLYGLLRHWVETRAGGVPELLPQRQSFDAACLVLDVILHIKRGLIGVQPGAERLQRVVSDFIRLHKAAYGEAHLRPKHHWLMDVAPQVVRDGLVLDAFIVERQHLLVRSVAENVRNTSAYEASILAGVWNKQFAAGRTADFGDGLLGPRGPLPDVAGVLVADRMLANTFEVAVDDVILSGGSVGIVVACYLQADGELGAIVRTTALRRQVSAHSIACVPTGGGVQAWPSTGVRHCLAWKNGGGELLVVCQ